MTEKYIHEKNWQKLMITLRVDDEKIESAITIQASREMLKNYAGGSTAYVALLASDAWKKLAEKIGEK
jgi:hypothetical protein